MSADASSKKCVRCSQLPGDGSAICDDCRDSRTVANALLGTRAPSDADRIAQLTAELAEVRRQHEAWKAEDIAARDAAQADLAAMRDLLLSTNRCLWCDEPNGPQGECHLPGCRAKRVLSGNAGRALAAHVQRMEQALRRLAEFAGPGTVTAGIALEALDEKGGEHG